MWWCWRGESKTIHVEKQTQKMKKEKNISA